jgi:hypothetical protein
MRASFAIACACLLAALAAGCGKQDDSTPVACLEGTSAYVGALGDAPGEVRLSGEVPISDCLAENQQAGDLATVGETMVRTATALNAQARADPGGAANLRLGYLIGAGQRGAERTNGIHVELVRRLTAAATYSPGKQVLGADFKRAYRQGFDAGLAAG